MIFNNEKKYGYSGNYFSWQLALNNCDGYDSDIILNKVRDSLLKVKKGIAAYERDSVVFDKIQYSWPLLSSLLLVASIDGLDLNVLDFGGSLGSTYFQNRHMLSHLNKLSWNIIEQEKFVLMGKKYFQTNELHFYEDISTYLKNNTPNVVLLLSVLPYIEDPYRLLDALKAIKCKYIIIDRTPWFIGDEQEQLTIQVVPKEIYPVSYPAWFLNKNKLLKYMSDLYEVVFDFESLAGKIHLKNKIAFEEGVLLKLKNDL